MGATPAWLTVALAVPDINEKWLQPFAKSLLSAVEQFGAQLIGGDMTRGPLSITVNATGFVDPDHIMRRDAAKQGDSIYVTGTLGDAALGLKLLNEQDQMDYFLARLNRPTPRMEFGQAVAEYCSCAIDISDGLVADLGHILKASQCGAEITMDAIPISTELRSYYDAIGEIDWNTVICSGDDYELCIVVSEQFASSVQAIADSMQLPLTKIGEITSDTGLQLNGLDGEPVVLEKKGYNHF